MIGLKTVSPDEPLLDQLKHWQSQVDAQPTYAEQILSAQQLWVDHNKKGHRTFDDIKCLLTELCSGGTRCCYCEDSLGYQIDHIWPKSIYPNLVFSWINYLYTCGSCNLRKHDRFAVFENSTGQLKEVQRRRPDPVIPPPEGSAVFIDPRIEDPMLFLKMDLRDTFELHPVRGLKGRQLERAKYTRDNLPLNSPPLLKQRRSAYGNYRSRLKEYIAERDGGTSPDRLELLRTSMLDLDHPTVWREMQRQQAALPVLLSLFQQAPEAQAW